MDAAWSVTFVSMDGEDVLAPIDVLSAASAIWRERFRLAGRFDSPTRSEETACTTAQVKTFLEVLLTTQSHETQVRPQQLGLGKLLLALPLVHKYDCIGMKIMIDEMNDKLHFTKEIIPKEAQEETLTRYSSHSTGYVETGTWYLCAGHLSQTHLDFIIAGQELYGVDFLNDNMKHVLALLLTYQKNRVVMNYTRGSGVHPVLCVQASEPDISDKVNGEVTSNMLVVQKWRLTAPTLASLLPFMCVKGVSAQ